MKEMNYASAWDLIGLEAEKESFPIDDVDEGSTFLAVDTKTVYILYRGTWYEL
jgi:hypothetical protein